MARSEQAILHDTLIGVSALPETIVWRHNTGMAWQGREVEARVGDEIRVMPGMKILFEARPVRFGLEGSGDIIGACGGRPVAIETKKPVSGRQRETQGNFERAWVKAGGIYLLVNDPSDAVAALR